MDSETRALVTWILGTVLAAGTLAAGAVRYILIPYLREHLIEPVAEVQKQVTEDASAAETRSHGTGPDQPTVLDRIEEVSRSVRALAQVIDRHLEWSERWTSLTEAEIELVREQNQLTREIVDQHHPHPHPEGDPDDH